MSCPKCTASSELPSSGPYLHLHECAPPLELRPFYALVDPCDVLEHSYIVGCVFTMYVHIVYLLYLYIIC